jgi:hypothetical protein
LDLKKLSPKEEREHLLHEIEDLDHLIDDALDEEGRAKCPLTNTPGSGSTERLLR